MSKVTTSINSLTSGEWSRKGLGRYDLQKYASGAKKLENFIINQLGGASFRPGTRFLAETKDSSKASRLIPFQYAADQDYVIEMGNLYMKFYENDGDSVTITPTDPYTKLLCHFNGTDGAKTGTAATGQTLTFVGTAQLDTASKEFGSASLLCDGDSDYVTVPNSNDWVFGTGDFTIDFWVRFSSVANSCGFYEQRTNDDNRIQLNWQTDNKVYFFVRGSATTLASYTFPFTPAADGTWYHIALVRSNSTLIDGKKIALFINGAIATATEVTAISTNSMPDTGAVLSLGYDFGRYLAGWMDEVRVSKGVARWTADFSASLPTAEYSTTLSPTTEVVTTYLEADIFNIQYAQNNDVLYLVHPDYAPRKLSRTSATEFTLSLVSFVRGPFMDDNITSTTITPSADTGAGITLTASTDTFDALHVGSLWRIKSGVVKISAVNSATEAEGDVQAEPDGSAGDLATGPAATTDWAEGAFSGYRGYPSAIAFHEQRLYYASTESEPQKFWGSYIGAYDSFDDTAATTNYAITFEVATEQRNAIKWLSSSNKALTIGTQGGTFSASSGDSTTTIAPANIVVSRDTNYGAAGIMPRRISSFLYYIQRDLLKLRELSYSFNIDAITSGDMTLLAEHVLRDGSGVVDMDHQQAPNDRIYCVRSDGEMAVLTRNPEQDVMGWSRFIAGADAVGNGKFESVCVIPKQDSDDQVWVIVKRNINGSTKRFIEFFMPEDFTDDFDPVRCDCSLTLDSPNTITGVTIASDLILYTAGTGAPVLAAGDYIKINGVVGTTEINGIFKISATDFTVGTSFKITTTDDVAIDFATYGAWISGGEIRKMVTNISGLDHLVGETVVAQVDGYLPSTETYVVQAGGTITLSGRAAVVHVGLPYEGTIQLLKFSDGSPKGTGQTQMRRIYEITLRLDKTQGLSIGRDTSNLGDLNYNDETDATALFTGDMPKVFTTTWSRGDEIIISQTKPLPASILAIVTESEVS
jgi:hypothetical protein